MRKVRLSGNAGAFLQREAKYLRERSPSAAGAFLDRLREVRRNLAQFPKIGRKKDGLPLEGTMQLVVGDYILDDDLDSEGVAISSIRHARQLDPDIERAADFDFEAGVDESAGRNRSNDSP